MKYLKHSTVPLVRRLWGALVLVTLGMASLWIASDQFLYFGDNLTFHYPAKELTTEIVADGLLPLWNSFSGGGQPLAGNPNYLTFYPTSLLYFLFSPTTAFNLHFFIHLFVAWFGMRELLRLHELESGDAAIVATIYLLSGTTISSLVFYNLIVAVAITPWAGAALIRLLDLRRTRDALYLGCWCGLLGLAAEPAMILGAAAIIGVIFLGRFSVRGIPLISLAILVSAIVASPQLVAFGEIGGEIERTRFSYGADWALAASIGPDRLAEMFTGPIFGSRLDHSPAGYNANATGRIWTPFLLSVMTSALLIPALLRRPFREIAGFQAVTVIFLLLALGRYDPAVVFLLDSFQSLSSLRHPEKFMIFLTLSGTILIGLLVRDLRRHPALSRRTAQLAALAIAAACATVIITYRTNPLTELRTAATAALQIVPLAALAFPRRVRNVPVAAGLLAIIPLATWAPSIIPLDDGEIYARPSPVARAVGDGPLHVPPSAYDWTIFDAPAAARRQAFRLNPTVGAQFGIRYAMYENPDGIQSYLSRLNFERFRTAPAGIARRYLSIYGVRDIVVSGPVPYQGISLSNAWKFGPEDVLHYEISETRPLIWEPREVINVTGASDAVEVIESPGFDPLTMTVAPSWVDAAPGSGAAISLLASDTQSIRFRVEAQSATIIVVNQTWYSAWKATTGGRELTTFPADVDRLGVVVPAGVSDIDLSFGRNRGLIAFATAVSAALFLYALGLAIWSSTRTAVPAR